MASWQILVALLVAAVSNASARSRVVGGSDATYASLVQVEFNIADLFWVHECGGTLLNNVYFLSAAHCFAGPEYDPAYRRIRAGTHIRGEGGVIVNVERELNHPTYGQNGNDGDISIVRLASFLTLGGNIQGAGLMVPGFVLPAGFSVTYAGWGYTDPDVDEFANTLQAVTTTVVDNTLCRLLYSNLNSAPPLTENMICAGNLSDGEQDACKGDAGGALFYNDILTGVISWGNGCGLSEYPGVSTQVSSYTAWIVQNTMS